MQKASMGKNASSQRNHVHFHGLKESVGQGTK